MRSRSSSLLGLSIINGVLLALLSIPSFIAFSEYMRNGGLEVPMEAEVCAYIFGPLLFVLAAPVILDALSLSAYATSDASRRALYVLVLLPVVVWGFMLASITEGFIPSLIMGMPLFITCAIAIPFSALVLHRHIMATLYSPYSAHIHCRFCGAQLVMAREDQYVKCRRCNAINANPFSGPVGDGSLPSPPPGAGTDGHPDVQG